MADNDPVEKPLSTGEWFITLLILAVPLVGFIMYFVWGFGAGNLGRRNFCRAALLWLVVLIVLVMLGAILFLVLGGTMAALVNQGLHR